MDYPFYIRGLFKVPDATLERIVSLLAEDTVIAHPHFVDPERNVEAFKQISPNAQEVIDLIAEQLNLILPWANLYWNEINQLGPRGKLGEHSDMAYAGYNKESGTPQEIVLTHKIHFHIKGQSILRHRRSKYEPFSEFAPVPGVAYWYNNYVLHESENLSETENRIAASLIYWDKNWKIRQGLYERGDFKFQRAYQV